MLAGEIHRAADRLVRTVKLTNTPVTNKEQPNVLPKLQKGTNSLELAFLLPLQQLEQ